MAGKRVAVYWISGCRDGIGKGMLARALADYLTCRDGSVVILDWRRDDDRERPTGADAAAERISVRDGSAFETLLELCARSGAKTIIVRSGAGTHGEVTRIGSAVDGLRQKLGRKLIGLWVLDGDSSSLAGLKAFMTAMACGVVHVICNARLGGPEVFAPYRLSRLRDAVEGNGGKTLTMPALSESIVRVIAAWGGAIELVGARLPPDDLAELEQWRRRMWAVLGEITG